MLESKSYCCKNKKWQCLHSLEHQCLLLDMWFLLFQWKATDLNVTSGCVRSAEQSCSPQQPGAAIPKQLSSVLGLEPWASSSVGALSSLGWQAADLTSRADEATGLLAPKPGPLPSAAVCPADTRPPCAHLAELISEWGLWVCSAVSSVALR